MTTINLPDPNISPSYEENGVRYIWDGEKWTSEGILESGDGGGIASLVPGVGLENQTGGANPDDAITDVGILGLADTAVVPGTYGTVTKVPVVVVDQQGRLTQVTEADIETADAELTLQEVTNFGNTTINTIEVGGLVVDGTSSFTDQATGVYPTTEDSFTTKEYVDGLVASSTANVEIGDGQTPEYPKPDAEVGDLWYNTDDGRTYVKITDGSGDENWVDAAPAAGGTTVGTLQEVTDNGDTTTNNIQLGTIDVSNFPNSTSGQKLFAGGTHNLKADASGGSSELLRLFDNDGVKTVLKSDGSASFANDNATITQAGTVESKTQLRLVGNSSAGSPGITVRDSAGTLFLNTVTQDGSVFIGNTSGTGDNYQTGGNANANITLNAAGSAKFAGTGTFGNQVRALNFRVDQSNGITQVGAFGSGEWFASSSASADDLVISMQRGDLYLFNPTNDQDNIVLRRDGSATFAGVVQSGGRPVNGTAVGSAIDPSGIVSAARTTGANAVFAGYTVGTIEPTSRINGNGSASFSSGQISLGVTGDATFLDGGILLNKDGNGEYISLGTNGGAFSFVQAGNITNRKPGGGQVSVEDENGYGITFQQSPNGSNLDSCILKGSSAGGTDVIRFSSDGSGVFAGDVELRESGVTALKLSKDTDGSSNLFGKLDLLGAGNAANTIIRVYDGSGDKATIKGDGSAQFASDVKLEDSDNRRLQFKIPTASTVSTITTNRALKFITESSDPIDFTVNGDTPALSLNADGSATFASTVSSGTIDNTTLYSYVDKGRIQVNRDDDEWGLVIAKSGTSMVSLGTDGQGYFAGNITAGNVTFNTGADDPANFDSEGVYTGPTLAVQDKLTDIIDAFSTLKTAAAASTDHAELKAAIATALANF